jgi:DMSO reductase anchor subunit
LVSSTFHLLHPRRAIYAFSQWRSSWLSREGVAAVATLIAAAAYGGGWVLLERSLVRDAILGALASIGAIVTVYSTGMIYAVLKPIREWHHPLVVPVYLLFALATGAVWLAALTTAFGAENAVPALVAVVVLVAAWSIKFWYWMLIDRRVSAGSDDTGMATGLGSDGSTVRSSMWPHTEANYLLKEMGFRIARKHAIKLRRIALTAGGAVPALLVVVSMLASSAIAIAASLLAVLTAMIGVLVERWLFFAEARHTVSLYYEPSQETK